MSKLMMTHSQRSVQPNKRKKWVSISSYSTLSSSLKPVLMKFFDKKKHERRSWQENCRIQEKLSAISLYLQPITIFSLQS